MVHWLAHPTLYRQIPRSIVFIGIGVSGIVTFFGLFGPRILNFHTTMQVITDVKAATTAIELDDDLAFLAEWLARCLSHFRR